MGDSVFLRSAGKNKKREKEEEKRVEGLIPCFCRKYLGRARVTRLTEGGCKKLLEALSLNAAQQVVDKCRLWGGKIECRQMLIMTRKSALAPSCLDSIARAA